MYSNWFSYDEVLHDDTYEEACCLECFVQAASEGPFFVSEQSLTLLDSFFPFL